MKKLSLNKCVDKIDKESVKAFLSYFLASESPRGGLVEDWIKCDDVMRLEPDFVIFNGSRFNNNTGQRIAIDYSAIESIEINYLEEDDDALALYIWSNEHLCLVFDRAIAIKPEICEMIERDSAEEFEW